MMDVAGGEGQKEPHHKMEKDGNRWHPRICRPVCGLNAPSPAGCFHQQGQLSPPFIPSFLPPARFKCSIGFRDPGRPEGRGKPSLGRERYRNKPLHPDCDYLASTVGRIQLAPCVLSSISVELCTYYPVFSSLLKQVPYPEPHYY